MVCNALVAGGRMLGAEQQGMRPRWGKLCDLSRTISLISDAQRAALHLTADHQQSRHYAPYAAITQV